MNSLQSVPFRGISFEGISLRGIPFEGLSISPESPHPCPFVCAIAENMCSRINDDKCKEKSKLVSESKLRFAEFLKFLRANYDEKLVEKIYTEEVARRIQETQSGEGGALIKSLPSIIGMPGGKSKLAKDVVELIPPHETYVEPFAGGASVFFKKNPAKKNVLNDLDKDLIDFYECFRKIDKEDLLKCNFTPSKERFKKLLEETPDNCKDIVCRYLYLNKASFGSKMETFTVSNPACKEELCVQNDKKFFEDFKKLLNKTTIKNEDFREVMRKYDSPNTFFYIDPPYDPDKCSYGIGGYHPELCNVTPEDIRDVVSNIKGKFVLSYDDNDRIRDVFKDFNLFSVETPRSFRTVAGKEQRREKELLISNFP